MQRYNMLGTAGGYTEIESETGTWVKFEDVAELLEAITQGKSTVKGPTLERMNFIEMPKIKTH